MLSTVQPSPSSFPQPVVKNLVQTPIQTARNSFSKSLESHIDELDSCLLHDAHLLRLSNAIRAGFLWRKSSVTGWYRYWFTLKGSQLYFFERSDRRRAVLAGHLNLFRSKAIVASSHKRTLEIDLIEESGKTHILRAESRQEMHFWLVAFAVARKTIPPAKKIHLLDPKSNAKFARKQIAPSHSDQIPVALLDSTQNADHVMFVVHGIGAKVDIFTRNIATLQESYQEIRERIFPDIEFNLEFVAIHWRKLLSSFESHERLRRLVPVSITDQQNVLRDFIVDKGIDFMYYFHPRYRNVILRHVTNQLNHQYSEFRQRHLDFNGNISLYAHSLGSVICYELLMRRAFEDPAVLRAEGLWLDFNAHNLFSVGSPLSEFLTLHDEFHILNRFNALPFRIYNIFHPNDPVAMRMEPLLEPKMEFIEPVSLPYWRTMNRHNSTMKWLGNMWSSSNRNSVSNRFESPVGMNSVNQELEKEEVFEGNEFVSKYGSRIDYALQVVSAMEEVSSTYSAAKAHTDYWSSRDVMLFILSLMLKQKLERDSRIEFDIESVIYVENSQENENIKSIETSPIVLNRELSGNLSRIDSLGKGENQVQGLQEGRSEKRVEMDESVEAEFGENGEASEHGNGRMEESEDGSNSSEKMIPRFDLDDEESEMQQDERENEVNAEEREAIQEEEIKELNAEVDKVVNSVKEDDGIEQIEVKLSLSSESDLGKNEMQIFASKNRTAESENMVDSSEKLQDSAAVNTSVWWKPSWM